MNYIEPGKFSDSLRDNKPNIDQVGVRAIPKSFVDNDLLGLLAKENIEPNKVTYTYKEDTFGGHFLVLYFSVK